MLMAVAGKQMLGERASAPQVLQLLNEKARQQKRKKATVRLDGLEVQLHELYNAVQRHGGSQGVSMSSSTRHTPNNWFMHACYLHDTAVSSLTP